MVVVNTENIPGREYQVLSLVTGCCVMCKNIGKDIGASFRNMLDKKRKERHDNRGVKQNIESK